MRIDEDRWLRICSLLSELQNEIRMAKSDNSANPAQLDPTFSPPEHNVCIVCDSKKGHWNPVFKMILCPTCVHEKHYEPFVEQ